MGLFRKKIAYGLLGMGVLAENYDKTKLLKAGEIAEKANVPGKYLSQILLRLKEHALVRSETGPAGGYSLMRSPEMISVAEVIDALGKRKNNEVEESLARGNYGAALDWLEGRFINVRRQFFSNISLSEFVKHKGES